MMTNAMALRLLRKKTNMPAHIKVSSASGQTGPYVKVVATKPGARITFFLYMISSATNARNEYSPCFNLQISGRKANRYVPPFKDVALCEVPAFVQNILDGIVTA